MPVVSSAWYSALPMSSTVAWNVCTTSAVTAPVQLWSAINAATISTATSNWIVYDTAGTWSAVTWNTAAAANWIAPIQKAPAVISRKTRRRLEAEERAQREAIHRATEERRQALFEAQRRARRLLYSALTRDQQRCLEERQYFDLNVNGRHYRIKQGTHGNVRLVEGEHETRLYCAQPDDVPAEDAMLAQKLMLEADEQAFLRIANMRVLRAA